jgi:RecB family exonuclease
MNVEEIWDQSFLEAIAETEAKTKTNPTDWRRGGRVSVANPDKENKAWWDVNGKKMFLDFIGAWKDSQLTIWESPQGVSGIEIELNSSFGDVLVKAYADLIAVTAGGELVVVDFKTGAYTPDSALQLGIYACAMEKKFGVRPTRGYYYSSRKATFLEAEGLHRWTIPLLTELFAQFNRGVENQIFLPNIGMACSTCGVKDYCYATGGELAQLYDPLATIK